MGAQRPVVSQRSGANLRSHAAHWDLGQQFVQRLLELGFRPEAGQITPEGTMSAMVYATELYGAYTMLHLNIGDVVFHIRGERGLNYEIGTVVRFDLDPEMLRLFDPQTEIAITREVH